MESSGLVHSLFDSVKDGHFEENTPYPPINLYEYQKKRVT